MLSQFFLADFFAKFFEDINEVFYTYKSIRIFIIFTENCPGVDLPLVGRSCHFDKSPNWVKQQSYFVTTVLCGRSHIKVPSFRFFDVQGWSSKQNEVLCF